MIQMNLHNRRRLADIEKFMVAEGKGAWDGHVHTSIFKMNNKQRPTVYSTWDSARCYVASWMVWGRRGKMDTCVYMAEFLHCSPETITTLLMCYTLIQNKKKILNGKEELLNFIEYHFKKKAACDKK